MRLLHESEMDPMEKKILQNCRNCLMEDLDPCKAFLASLQCAGILTEDQKERIEKQVTRQDKVISLLEILPRRGPKAFRLFVGVLRTDYQWISDRLQAELSVQEHTKKILTAVEDRMKQNGEFIRDKDYIFKILNETIIPILIQEMHDLPSSSPTSQLDKSLRSLITENLLPLLNKSKGKMKLDTMPCEVLMDKIVGMLEDLYKKCCKSLGVEVNIDTEVDEPLPDLIEKCLADFKNEAVTLKKEAKKFKKVEEKFTVENQKLKSDVKTLREDVKRLKSEGQSSRVENKKLKDEVKKQKADNEKLKLEMSHLKEILNKAGIDLRISSDFCSQNEN